MCVCVCVCVCGCMCVCICIYVYLYACVCTRAHTHAHAHKHTLEYYSATKKNEILPFAMTWIELDGIMLSEISQLEKDNNHMISLI